MYYSLTDRFTVTTNVQSTWGFFSSAENLPAITPPSLRFVIQTPSPIILKQDSIIDYTVHVMRIPVRWRTLIIDWTPPTQFIDLQIRGPYSLWHHQHTFTPVDGGVECSDRVIYRVPPAGLGRAVHALFVRRQLLEIFRFRRRMIAERLGWVKGNQEDVMIRRIGG